MAFRSRDQLAMDERLIEDQEVESALETREKRKEAKSAVTKTFKEADTAARAAIQRLELPAGAVVRVGRFRISRKDVGPRSVSFDTAAKSRITISPIDDEN